MGRNNYNRIFPKTMKPFILTYLVATLAFTGVQSQYYTNSPASETRPQFPADYLSEYSVIYTDRAVNLMSATFKEAMRDTINLLKVAYGAESVALIPGSGTYGMESVARQFATRQKAMVIRNGYFSFRWSEIDEWENITDQLTVIKAEYDPHTRKVSPPSLQTVIEQINKVSPAVFFMPHVETSVGLLLNDDYISAICEAVHAVGGLVVLDGIAAGSLWVNMRKLGVDVYLTAPQKSWTSPAGFAIVILGQRAVDKLETTKGTSFSLDLKKWIGVSDSYMNGGFSYHTTVPSDVIMTFRDAIKEAMDFGLEEAKQIQISMGNKFRVMLEARGFPSVASDETKGPTVIVSYCKENMVPKFAANGIQVAGKVAFKLDEPSDLMTFRIGLFGLDKLANPELTLSNFEKVLDKILAEGEHDMRATDSGKN